MYIYKYIHTHKQSTICRDWALEYFCTSFKEYQVRTTERDTDFPFSSLCSCHGFFCSQRPYQTHHPKQLVTSHTHPPLFELIGWLAVCPFCHVEESQHVVLQHRDSKAGLFHVKPSGQTMVGQLNHFGSSFIVLFQGEHFVWPGIAEYRRALRDLQLLSSSQPQRFRLCVHKSEIALFLRYLHCWRTCFSDLIFSVVCQPANNMLELLGCHLFSGCFWGIFCFEDMIVGLCLCSQHSDTQQRLI